MKLLLVPTFNEQEIFRVFRYSVGLFLKRSILFLAIIISTSCLAQVGKTSTAKDKRLKRLVELASDSKIEDVGLRLSHAKEVLRSTSAGDTTYRLRAYSALLFCLASLQDEHLFNTYKNKYLEEFKRYPAEVKIRQYITLSDHSRLLGMNELGFEYAEKAFDIARNNHTDLLNDAILLKALNLQQLHKNKEALDEIRKLESLNSVDEEDLEWCLRLKLASFIEMREIDSVQLLAEKFAAIDIAEWSTYEQVFHNMLLGECYMVLGDFRTSDAYYSKAYNQIETGLGSFTTIQYYVHRVEFYKEKGDYLKATLYRDSIFEIQNNRDQQNQNYLHSYLQQEQEFIERKSKIQLVKKNRKLEVSETKSQVAFWFSLSMIILACMVVLLIIYFKRISRRKISTKELEKQTEILGFSLEQKKHNLGRKLAQIEKHSEMISEIKQKIRNQNVDSEGAEKKLFQDISSKIAHRANEQLWEEFQTYFSELHSDFYELLVLEHPNLTVNERRLCAFLRMGMSSRSISDITGQSISSIEVARTRLRKKLGITNSDISFLDYFDTLLERENNSVEHE